MSGAHTGLSPLPRFRREALLAVSDTGTGRQQPMILGVETSCDETAVALVTDGGEIRANVVASQADLHARFGGVVPEVASRRHLELITPVVREALGQAGATLDDVDRIAVTQGPGLIGALLVGIAAAKAIAWSRHLPLVPVDHLNGHIASLYLAARSGRAAVPLPARKRRAHDADRRPQLHRAAPCSARRSTTRPARPSTRARASSGSTTPAAASSTGSRARATLPPTTSPSPACPASTSPSPASRRRSSTRRRDLAPAELEQRRADLAASYQRAIVRALVGPRPRGRHPDRRRPDRRRRRRRGELRAPRGARRRRPRAPRPHAPTTPR